MDASGDSGPNAASATSGSREAGNNHGSTPMCGNTTPGQPMSQSKSASSSSFMPTSTAVPSVDPQTANMRLQSMETYLNYLGMGSTSTAGLDSSNTPTSCSSASNVPNNESSSKSPKKHICPVCRMDFSDWKDWRGHVRGHTDFRPHHCSMCEKSFCDLYKLRRHEQTHTGVKPYQCHICDTRVSRQEHLRRHLLTHMDDKPYRCSACSVSARRPDIVRSHIRAKHLPVQELATVVPVFSIADVEKHLNVSSMKPTTKKKKKKKKQLSTSNSEQGDAAQPLSEQNDNSSLVMPVASATLMPKPEMGASMSCLMPQMSPPLNMSEQTVNEQRNSLQLSPVQAKDPIMLDSARKSIINSMAHKLGRNVNKLRQPSPTQSRQDCERTCTPSGNFNHASVDSNLPGGITGQSVNCPYPLAIISNSGPNVSMSAMPSQPGMVPSPYFSQNWIGPNIFPNPALIPNQGGGIHLPGTVAGSPPMHVSMGQFVQGPLGITVKSEGP